MRIANPIYDAVFKYLMDDNKIAKKLLSLIIGTKIKSIKLTPKEFENKEAYQHFVNIDENDYPEEYTDIIRRLIKAAAKPDVMDKMDIEDELIEEFEEIERELEKTTLLLEERELQLKEKKNLIQDKELQVEGKEKLLDFNWSTIWQIKKII